MVNYRRNLVAGGTYFFTVNLRDRRANTLTTNIELLRESFRLVKHQKPFEIVAIVVLPDHKHMIMELSDEDDDYAGRWRAIKSHFSRKLRKAGAQLQPNAKGELGIWQRRFWEHQIRDDRDMQAHVDYIHYNPVKHAHVRRVVDWPYSSFHRFVERGDLASDWGGAGAVMPDGGFGE